MGLVAYDSGESEPETSAAPVATEPEAKRARTEPAVAVAAKAPAAPSAPRKDKITPQKLKEVRKEISDAKSATAVVQAIRRHIESSYDVHWAAEALYQVAKRSTARTRKDWAEDKGVKKLADRLSKEADSSEILTGKDKDDVDIILLILESVRRMELQEPENQKFGIERAINLLVADGWNHPVKSLARLFMLGAPLTFEGKIKEHFLKELPLEIRARATEMDGPDLALLIAGMRGEKGIKDSALLSKVALRLKDRKGLSATGAFALIHVGLSVTDIVEMAEGLLELAVTDEAALRMLGQEALRRRGELTPDESHRIHSAYQALKLPLPKVWRQSGAEVKREGAQIITTTAFKPQEGHEKKRRGNHDIEKTSPPRVVRDMKMCSY
ncbi:unnamed protein product [Polarella glacialis]|uniref:Uncharacterized protein n=1 Tax=Polarella glacialis TaxID=89957 RepID=A0A813DJW1_POLGL|nr:unnamed protein product [Polarella glacialis]